MFSGFIFFFFFSSRRRHTRSLRDWSSDVCSSDLAPQFLWFKRVRSSPPALWVIALIVSIGMWLERFVIIVVSLHRDFLPSSWGMYHGTIWDISTYLGTLGLFLTLMFLFI